MARSKPYQSLYQSLRPTLKSVLGTKGALMTDLFDHWLDILGSEATSSFPNEIKFPSSQAKIKGTLWVQAPAHRMVALAYQESLWIEKINLFMGYELVAKIRFSPIIKSHT